MQLNKIQDQRSPLHKLTQKELEYLAKKEERDDVIPGMPADLMRQKFFLKPPSAIPRPMRGHLGSLKGLRIPRYEEWLKVAFGQVAPAQVQEPEVQEVSAADDLQRQWQAQRSVGAMTIVELRKECKRRGIKMKRTDKIADLRAKLNGHNASA